MLDYAAAADAAAYFLKIKQEMILNPVRATATATPTLID